MTETNVLPNTEAFTAAAERVNDQARVLGERVAASAREAGGRALDSYEKAVESYLELQQKAADAAPTDSLKTAIETYAAFVKEFNEAYVKAARTALS